jgi:hypothetical protein
MKMRMVLESLAPCVQNGDDTNLGPQMLWVGGDDAERLGRRLEQYAVDDGFVGRRSQQSVSVQ